MLVVDAVVDDGDLDTVTARAGQAGERGCAEQPPGHD